MNQARSSNKYFAMVICLEGLLLTPALKELGEVLAKEVRGTNKLIGGGQLIRSKSICTDGS